MLLVLPLLSVNIPSPLSPTLNVKSAILGLACAKEVVITIPSESVFDIWFTLTTTW